MDGGSFCVCSFRTLSRENRLIATWFFSFSDSREAEPQADDQTHHPPFHYPVSDYWVVDLQ